jgi:hypothetical protein
VTSSAVLLEEFVSLIIVIGRSDVGACACMDGIIGIAKRVEDAKSVDIKSKCSLSISNLCF